MENKLDSTPESKPAQSSGTASAAGKTSAFQGNSGNVMQSFKSNKNEPSAIKVLLVLLIMAGLGIGTGYGVALLTGGKTSTTASESSASDPAPENPKKGETYGDGDIAEFKDTAEGILKEGGIEGEGQYHLEREGGESQNVYMTSSSVDLSKFIDKKIKVWGQTQTAQTAGWLMDVGKVEVL